MKYLGLFAVAVTALVLANSQTDRVVALPPDTIQVPTSVPYQEPADDPVPDRVIDQSSVDPVSGYVASGPTVVMLSTAGCLPCEQWRNSSRPAELRSKGWHVDTVQGVASPTGYYPVWRVYDGNTWQTLEHPYSHGRLRSLLSGSAKVQDRQADRMQADRMQADGSCQCGPASSNARSVQDSDGVVYQPRRLLSRQPVRRLLSPVRTCIGGFCQ